MSHWFDRRGRIRELWSHHADELHDAAVELWAAGTVPDGTAYGHQLRHYRPGQLLMGLSLEVALKGLLVARDPSLVANGELAGKLKTHSLESLFNEAQIPLEPGEDELNLVRRLSDAIEWVSRYPVPKKAAHLESSKNRARQPLSRNSMDLERFEALWARIRQAQLADSANGEQAI